MGGSVSSGRDNDELIDNLCDSSHVKSEQVEKLFRAVDRGSYYLPTHRDVAYRDLAWREGNIHISAPCIYSEVMESLELERGNSFLNIGSGTGYLSTMVGLQLGPYGVNHNIEIHADVIDYAKARLNEFIRNAPKFDHFDFCVPKFVHGNFLNITVDKEMGAYDRIYVGCGVGHEHLEFIKSLLKPNGVLVMPLEDYLVQFKRKSETEYERKTVMSVSFATFINEHLALNSILMPKIKPLSLQELCRYRIRELLRKSIDNDYTDYYRLKKRVKKVRADDDMAGESSARARRIFLTRNTLTEAQLRMLIHGRLFDRNNYPDDDDDDDEEVEEEVEQQQQQESVVEVEQQEDDITQSSSLQDEASAAVASSNNNEHETKAIPIPQKDSKNSICESGFSESEQSSSLELANSLAKDIVVPNSSDNNKKKSTTSDTSTSTTTTDFDSVGSQDSCFLSDTVSTSSSFNSLFHKNLTVNNDTTPAEAAVPEPETSNNMQSNEVEELKPVKEEEKRETTAPVEPVVEEVYVNHLRNRILKLEIPTALKNFLLYNRDI